MPVISRFYGITIRMFYNDHSPPHFHAAYGEHELIIGLSPISILEGAAPRRVQSLVLEWAALHHGELLANWDLCHVAQAPTSIEPLE